MNKIVKKVIFILILFMILFSINTEVHAWSQIIEEGKDFVNTGKTEGKEYIDIDANSIQHLSGYLYNLLLSAGVVIAVIVATVLGIQFMIGGAEGQAKVKEMIVPFVVGCIVVFGGFGIWKIAINIGNRIENAQIYEPNENIHIACMHEFTKLN